MIANHNHGGMLIISHDRQLLRLMDRIFELSNQEISQYGGNFDFFSEQKSLEKLRKAKQLEQAKKLKRKKAKERLKKIGQQEKRMRPGAANAAKSGIPKILLGKRKSQAQISMGKIAVQQNEFVDQTTKEIEQLLKEQKKDSFIPLNFIAVAVNQSKIVLQFDDLNFRFDDFIQIYG